MICTKCNKRTAKAGRELCGHCLKHYVHKRRPCKQCGRPTASVVLVCAPCGRKMSERAQIELLKAEDRAEEEHRAKMAGAHAALHSLVVVFVASMGSQKAPQVQAALKQLCEAERRFWSERPGSF